MGTVLVFVDFSPTTSAIIRIARKLAQALSMNAILLHVSTPDADAEGGQMRRDLSRRGIALEMRQYQRELNILAMECMKLGVETTGLLVRGRSTRGNPVPKMVSEIKRIKPSLIVMGTHQHSRFFEAMFGSASSKVIHKAPCPILLIPSNGSARNRSFG